MFRVSGRDSFNKGVLLVFSIVFFLLVGLNSEASTPALDVKVTEYLSQVVAYDQSYNESNQIVEARGEKGENRTGLSRTGVELQEMKIYGIINISNVETMGNQTLVSVNVTLNGTDNVSRIELISEPVGDYLVYNVSSGHTPINNETISIFISELRANHSVIFRFNISGEGLGEPLNLTEEYSSWRMMTGDSTKITLNASNSFPRPILLSEIVVTKTPDRHLDSGGNPTYFRFTNLGGEDSGNATIYEDAGRTVLQWNVSGGELGFGESTEIEFDAWSPENLSISWHDYEDWAAWVRIGNISSSFTVNGTMSGIELINVTGISPAARFAVSKERTNETHWNATFNITNDAVAALDYELTHVSIWATRNLDFRDPGDMSNWVNGTNVSAYSLSGLTGPYANYTWWPKITLRNGTSNSNYTISFNYSAVPIVWSQANFEILDDGTQIFKLNKTDTIQDGYLFIEEIYVLLGGYLMKVTKLIEPIDLSPDINKTTYLINVTVENVGQERSPEYVSMFDLVPKDFHPVFFLVNQPSDNRTMYRNSILRITDFDGGWSTVATTDVLHGGSDTGEIQSGPYQGYWGYHLDMKALNSSSDGDGFFDSSLSRSEVGIAYKIVGNKTISLVENAYLVGVDPIRLEGANPSRTVISLIRAWSDSWEYAVSVLSLIMSLLILAISMKIHKTHVHNEKKKQHRRKKR